MYEKVSSVSRSLAWVGILVLSAGFLVWSISVLVFKQPLFPQGIPEIFSPFSEPAPAASDLNLQPLDLGPDWALTMDETEFRPNTYWDIDETGLPMIGEHQNTSEPLFLPGDLETYSVRGYSNKDREAVVFASVVIFKEEARAVSLVDQMFPQMLQDSDIPEENQALQVAEIGAEETQAYLIQTQEGRDGLTRAASGGFHKGRVVFIFYVINYQEGGIPLSQDQLWELATTVEARIRTGQ